MLPPDAVGEANRLRAEELTNLKRDIELLPDSGPTYYRLGLTHYLLGQLDEAEQALSKATELAPTVYEFWTALALLQERRQEYDAAAQTLGRMIQLRPEDPTAQQIFTRMQRSRTQSQPSALPGDGPAAERSVTQP